MPNFLSVKKRVVAEIDVRPMNDTKMYNFVLRLFNGDAKLTRSFLMNEGYTYGEINQVIRQKESRRYLLINQ